MTELSEGPKCFKIGLTV